MELMIKFLLLLPHTFFGEAMHHWQAINMHCICAMWTHDLIANIGMYEVKGHQHRMHTRKMQLLLHCVCAMGKVIHFLVCGYRNHHILRYTYISDVAIARQSGTALLYPAEKWAGPHVCHNGKLLFLWYMLDIASTLPPLYKRFLATTLVHVHATKQSNVTKTIRTAPLAQYIVQSQPMVHIYQCHVLFRLHMLELTIGSIVIIRVTKKLSGLYYVRSRSCIEVYNQCSTGHSLRLEYCY